MATQVRYRALDFRFDDDIRFHFNPRNLATSEFVNSLSFLAPAFESDFINAFRDAIPRVCDARISSFILWHFVEEFEHRNCAIDVFDDIVGRHGHRLRHTPPTRRGWPAPRRRTTLGASTNAGEPPT